MLTHFMLLCILQHKLYYAVLMLLVCQTRPTQTRRTKLVVFSYVYAKNVTLQLRKAIAQFTFLFSSTVAQFSFSLYFLDNIVLKYTSHRFEKKKLITAYIQKKNLLSLQEYHETLSKERFDFI